MISKTISILRNNWWFFLFFAALLTVAAGINDAGFTKSSTTATTTFLWLLLARFVHRAALFNVGFNQKNADGTADKAFIGFVLKGLALTAIALVVAAPVLFLLFSSSSEQTGWAVFYLGFGIAFLLTYSVVLALLGSWLPAAVYGQNKSFGAAFQRGLRNFGSVFIRTLPILLITIVLQIAAMLVFVGYGFDASVIAAGKINAIGVVFTMAVLLTQCVSVTLISVVLSHYYLEYEGLTAGQPLPPA